MYVNNINMDDQEEYLRGYKDVRIFKAQRLGVGSYGAVYRAKCDQLPCAAKIMHPTLLEGTPQEEEEKKERLHQNRVEGKEHRKPANRFQQECQFLSEFRHPNIIQYIGVCWDHSSGLPVLLMELMDQNLTQFLEQSPHKPLSLHTSVNISQDIALAVAFLHTNNIWHRDLSSNNILLLGDRRAKVTDFGMAKIFSKSECTKTRLPGTAVYMSPESLDETPEYSDKLDVFSYGVLVIQILCRLFPKPSKKMRAVTGSSMYEKVSEVKRRKSHIDMIPGNHPLLPLALECIADSEHGRPTAKEITETFKPIKSLAQYTASERTEEEWSQSLKELMQRSSNSEGVSAELLKKLQEKDYAIAELEHASRQKDRRIQQLQTSMNIQRQDYEAELESQASRYMAKLEILERMEVKTNITVTAQESARAPRAMYRMSNAVKNGGVIYLAVSGDVYEDAIYSLNLAGGVWSALPPVDENRKWSTNTIAIVCGELTTIGGSDEDENVTNQLFTFVGRGSTIGTSVDKGDDVQWDEIVPPMKYKRDNAIAFTSGSHLIVAGGMSESNSHLRSVEILNTTTMQWAESEPLTEPLSSACATLCEDIVYLLGGWTSDKTPTSAVHTCSVSDLIAACRSPVRRKSAKIWKRVADLPVLKSTAVCYQGHLIAVGGVDVMNRATTVVNRYDKSSDCWMVIGHLQVPRGQPFAILLPDYDVTLVIGGHKGYYINKIYEVEEVVFRLQN